jgi:formylglycine-generating enzyme required for sulfatase activity
MSYQPSPPKKSNAGLWIGGAAILLVALIAIVVLLLNRPSAPAAPAAAVIVSAETATVAPPTATPIAVNTPTPAPTETPTSTPMPELGTSNLFIEYILDASGSMSETLSDGSPKIEVAQRVLTEHMRSFRPETNIGLRVYGHRLPYQQTDESCQDIELIAPPEKGQMERIASWLQDFTVQGMTPLAASLELAKDDFIYDASRINSIVMLSDGIETCGGDPCRLVEDLKAEGINFTIHVIGLDVDDPTRQQLSCIAEAGDGTYHDARSQDDLDAALGAVRADVTEGEVVVPPGVDTPTPLLPTFTPTQEPPTPTPALEIGSTMVSEKDGMEMVYVPAGEFLMGSTGGEGRDDEHPQHAVYLDAYWIDKTEVTVAQYQHCVETGTCLPSRPDSNSRHCTIVDDAKSNHPINCVSWSQAAAYCGWVDRRLPTEAEWEKAARGVDGRLFPWGNQEPNSTLLNYDTNVDSITTPVGQYPAGASPYGALDMAGNVHELVADWYDESYYRYSPRDNPQGPPNGEYSVLRGGSWVNASIYVRAAARLWSGRDNAYDGGGFRCADSP